MTGTVLAVERTNPLMMLLVFALGCWGLYFGIQTWRGKEASVVEKVQRQGQSGRWTWGGRLRYQTYLGAGLMGIPFGLSFILGCIGVFIRNVLDKPSDWGPWYAIAVVYFVLACIGGLYSFAYFWTGVPNWLRPPSQRSQTTRPRTDAGEPRWKRLRQLRE